MTYRPESKDFSEFYEFMRKAGVDFGDAAYQKARQALYEEKQRLQREQIRRMMNGDYTIDWGDFNYGYAGYTNAQTKIKDTYTTIEELNNAIEHLKAAKRQASPPKPKQTKEERRAEIEAELDIIRGRVPTPKGYTINPAKIKALQKELQTL